MRLTPTEMDRLTIFTAAEDMEQAGGGKRKLRVTVEGFLIKSSSAIK